jgi:hypothetical protein
LQNKKLQTLFCLHKVCNLERAGLKKGWLQGYPEGKVLMESYNASNPLFLYAAFQVFKKLNVQLTQLTTDNTLLGTEYLSGNNWSGLKKRTLA